jgi:phosphotransferase system IIB component
LLGKGLEDACAETRLRIVTTNGALDEAALKAAGVEAVVRLPDHVVHLLTGPNANQYAAEMRGHLLAEIPIGGNRAESASSGIVDIERDRMGAERNFESRSSNFEWRLSF